MVGTIESWNEYVQRERILKLARTRIVIGIEDNKMVVFILDLSHNVLALMALLFKPLDLVRLLIYV